MEITDEEIDIVEKILGQDLSFDIERRNFIKKLETVDLQAVPGSGKTTALLAKLIILDKKMPFKSGGGVLMLSHTNAAIDEIKQKIGLLCPRLFEYPNFVGTIQSFIDTFFAIPYYANHYKTRPSPVNSDLYYSKLDKVIVQNLIRGESAVHKQVLYIKKSNEDFIKNIRFGINDSNQVILINGLNGEKLEIKRPGSSRSKKWVDYSLEEKEIIYKYLKKAKSYLLKDGVMHYDDAYFLANYLLVKNPNFKNYIQKRFKLIFVDEMQDMDTHQVSILENLFGPQNSPSSIYQRIGDKNQAIHSNITSKDSWNDRFTDPMKISGSHRLTPEVANVVKNFGIEFVDIQGLGISSLGVIKPHIIIFDNPAEVLEKFTNLITQKELQTLNLKEQYPFRAIGWRESHDEDGRLGIKDYWPSFKKDPEKVKTNQKNLHEYLIFNKRNITTLEVAQDSILDSFLQILRMLNQKTDRDTFYTKNSILTHIKEENYDLYKEFKQKLYDWSLAIFKKEDVHDEVIIFFRKLLREVFLFEETESDELKNFIETKAEDQTEDDQESDSSNIHESNRVKVKIGTIHSVKGETHTATLYLENFYYGEYESQRLAEQVNGTAFTDDRARHKESTKMVYVGFSRCTHLLCFAIHRSRKFEIDENIWEIIE